MPSTTGLQKCLRRYVLFLIAGLCITALVWGAASAQLNTRAVSFDEDAARVHLILDQPDGFHLQTGAAYWLIERSGVEQAAKMLSYAPTFFPAVARCLWETVRSGAALINGIF